MRRPAILAACAVLAACDSPIGAVAALTGAGPSLAANVQTGRSNAQTLGVSTHSDQQITRPQARSIEQSAGRTGVRSEQISTVVVREGPPPWLLLVALIGWLLPTPQQIGSALAAMVSRPFSRVPP
ncbi:bacteriophage spanin2 family protein [Phaeobacter inhibens]|uniref:bacteriophage spanin2 family protein n=1 Tax=Phaeobacter inhibens TaxID=221822 RepID=UPI0001632C7E|nr:bacteriophage spanin2 family protein [Phaeobacter inhibens]AFO91542.1 hypothetical protein PGA1_c18450 [Phaeobacter inhibens DSM 17395]AUQ46209.1 hypothetical protein PhaeoP10_01871 [Phaeobacter inhibens]